MTERYVVGIDPGTDSQGVILLFRVDPGGTFHFLSDDVTIAYEKDAWPPCFHCGQPANLPHDIEKHPPGG